MITVETVIRKLVSEYEFVIIPGFGALLSHQIQATYNADTQTYLPPAKKLAFNEFLKLDDGVLANFISREENIEHLQAVAYIREYAENLRFKLQSDGFTEIVGVGEFRSNNEGKLIFEPNTDSHFKNDWYGFSGVKVASVGSRNSSYQATRNNGELENEVEVLELEENTKLRINWMGWGAAAVVAGLAFFISLFLVNSDRINYKSTLNPFDKLFEHSVALKQKENKVKPGKVAKIVLPDTVSTSIADSATEIASAVKPDTKSVATLKPEVLKEQQFYLIAGAFKGTRQAKVLLAELVAKGYADAVLLPATASSTKVKVAVQGFNNENEAYAASTKLKKVIGEVGWVYKRN